MKISHHNRADYAVNEFLEIDFPVILVSHMSIHRRAVVLKPFLRGFLSDPQIPHKSINSFCLYCELRTLDMGDL